MATRARKPAAPAGLGPSGLKLWRHMHEDYEFGPHEVVILAQAVRILDACDWLQATADDPDEPTVQRRRALAELRGQRALLARLLTAIVPAEPPAAAPANDTLARLRRIHGRTAP